MSLLPKLLPLLIALTCLPAVVSAATCSGGADCHACTTCGYCKNCAQNGGTCSVCSSKYNHASPSHKAKTKHKHIRKH